MNYSCSWPRPGPYFVPYIPSSLMQEHCFNNSLTFSCINICLSTEAILPNTQTLVNFPILKKNLPLQPLPHLLTFTAELLHKALTLSETAHSLIQTGFYLQHISTLQIQWPISSSHLTEEHHWHCWPLSSLRYFFTRLSGHHTSLLYLILTGCSPASSSCFSQPGSVLGSLHYPLSALVISPSPKLYHTFR